MNNNNSQIIIHFETLGCKLNQIESESIAKAFFDETFSIEMKPITSKTEQNDGVKLCIINTCTVTSKSEQKARRIIRLLLEKFKNATVIVTGCYAEVESEQIKAIDSRIVVLKGTLKDTLSSLPKEFAKILQNAESQKTEQELINDFFAKSSINNATFKLSTDNFFAHSRASIKIQDGCANKCSYCRIHIARGKPFSLDANTVLERVKQLEANGQGEVVLTGVNLSQYISYFDGKKIDFADLLKILLENTSSIHFRISSLYPDRIDEALLPFLQNERVCSHFHLSIQSGSDKILKLMNRTYLQKDVINAVKNLRLQKPDCFIACDIIVGFPGETDQDFAESVQLAKTCKFSWIHVFPFSARPGTQAFSMKNKVPESVAKERAKLLTDVAEKQKQEYLESCVGKTFRAIVEKRRTFDMRAVTDNFIHTKIMNSYEFEPESIMGKTVLVEITSVINKRSQTESPEAKCKIIKIF